MKVTYTGRQEKFTPAQTKKLDAKLAKLAKLLDHRGGEREAHIILTSERHLRRAEITVNLHDHPMVGVAAEADQFTAILSGRREAGEAGAEAAGQEAGHQARAEGGLASRGTGGGRRAGDRRGSRTAGSSG